MTLVGEKLRQLQSQARSALLVDGPTELRGEVHVQGAKNTALKVIPGLAAFPRTYLLKNTPTIIDTLELFHVLEYLGATVELAPDTVRVDTTNLTNRPIPFDVTRRTTTSFYLAGALLGRFGSVEIGKPGGDEIGARPVDLHVDAFRALGAEVHETDTMVAASLPGSPAGGDVRFRMPSAGAAVNAALAAAHGRAVITTYPNDSDMQGFFEFLRRCGCAVVEEDGRLVIDGTNASDGEVTFECPPDRNDAMTWLQAGAFSEAGITVRGVDLTDLDAGLAVLRELGIRITELTGDSLNIQRPDELVIPPDYTVVAGASPGFHSDWAPFLQLVLSSGTGVGKTIDTLHSNRVRQAELLGAMGADITIAGGSTPDDVTVHFRTPLDEARYQVAVRGPAKLRGLDAAVGNDVRACATAVLAATQAIGQSRLTDMYALYRGYEDYPERLRQLGARIGS